MIKIYTILHSARTNVKGNAIIYLRINGLDKEVNISTGINIKGYNTKRIDNKV